MKLITLGNSDFDLRNKVEVMFGGLTPTARFSGSPWSRRCVTVFGSMGLSVTKQWAGVKLLPSEI